MLPLMWLKCSCHKLKDINMPEGRVSFWCQGCVQTDVLSENHSTKSADLFRLLTHQLQRHPRKKQTMIPPTSHDGTHRKTHKKKLRIMIMISKEIPYLVPVQYEYYTVDQIMPIYNIPMLKSSYINISLNVCNLMCNEKKKSTKSTRMQDNYSKDDNEIAKTISFKQN